MALHMNSNIDEEIEKLNKYKKTLEDINKIPIDIDISKAVLTMEQVAEMLHCSERAAREALQSEGAPLVTVGRKPLISVTALYEHITNYGLGLKGA